MVRLPASCSKGKDGHRDEEHQAGVGRCLRDGCGRKRVERLEPPGAPTNLAIGGSSNFTG
jgi:hypothetical protein